MGFDDTLGMAFAKAQASAWNPLPREGTVAVTVHDRDKATVTPLIRRFHAQGFGIIATRGTLEHLQKEGIPCERIFKVGEGRPDIVDRITSGAVQLLVNTPLGQRATYDEYAMRRAAITYKVAYLTTMSATAAAAGAVEALRSDAHRVTSLQERVVRVPETAAPGHG